MKILRTVKVKIEGATFCLLRPSALEGIEISTMISQLNSSESEEKYKELAEVYINILQKYTKEIRDIELENEEGELETVVVKSEDLLAYVIQHISLQTLSKLIVEYLSSLNPTESEKKS